MDNLSRIRAKEELNEASLSEMASVLDEAKTKIVKLDEFMLDLTTLQEKKTQKTARLDRKIETKFEQISKLAPFSKLI